MFSACELAEMVCDVICIYDEFSKTPYKAFRKFDGRTPYGVHPVFTAMLLLHEENLPEIFRVRGAKVLLAHDIFEDTNADLPEWCSPDVACLVRKLTFSDSQDSSVEIWSRGDEAILLKFYDVVANLMCVGKMNREAIQRRRKQARNHLSWVKERYPQLEIVKIAEGLLA
jgi:hypothetical protein